MGYWTINYPKTGVEKTFQGWGISMPKIHRRNQVPDECNLLAEGQAFDTPNLFDFGEKVVIYRDRDMDRTGNFSGGTIHFVGRCGKPQRVAGGDSENVTYPLFGLLWDFEQLTFERQFLSYFGPAGTICPGGVCPAGFVTNGTYDFKKVYTTHTVMNLKDFGVWMGMRDQLAEIFDHAILNGSDFQYTKSALPDATIPPDDKSEITDSRAIQEELKWVPDCFMWVDCSTTPPTLNLKRRADMDTVTLDAAEGKQIEGLDITERSDLRVPQVVFRFEREDNGWTNIFEDKYPTTDPAIKFGRVIQTLNLVGLQSSVQVGYLDVRAYNVASPAWWRTKVGWLADVTIVNLYDVTIAPSGDGSVGAGELFNGNAAEWMKLGNGTPIYVTDCTAQATVDYTLPDGSIKTGEKLSVNLRTTNGAGGYYRQTTVSQAAEPVPTGMARTLFEALDAPQYEGSFTVTDVEVSKTIKMGMRVNLTNGEPGWATMAMPIQSITEDLETGSMTVFFGPNRYLSPEELIDRLRANRARNVTPGFVMLFGNQNAMSSISFPVAAPKENATTGASGFQKLVIKTPLPE